MSRKLSIHEFIQKANQVHNNLYDYSKTKYKSAHEKVCILDLEYGEFWQSPANHLKGHGYPHYPRKKRLLTKTFITRANKIHSNLYDYTKSHYKHAHTKICIMDPEFGEFWQRPDSHLAGRGNPRRAHITKCNHNPVHKDHIIPISILDSRKTINKERPLYKFLNSDINIQQIPSGENNAKSDWIQLKDMRIRARDVRNNYDIIKQLAENLLNTNIDNVIEEDKNFLQA